MIWAHADGLIARTAGGGTRLSGVEETTQPLSALKLYSLVVSLAVIVQTNAGVFAFAALPAASAPFLAVPFFIGVLLHCVLVGPLLLPRRPAAAMLAAAALSAAGGAACRSSALGGPLAGAGQFLIGAAAACAMQNYDRLCAGLTGPSKRSLAFVSALGGVAIGATVPAVLSAKRGGDAALKGYLNFSALAALALIAATLPILCVSLRERAPPPEDEERLLSQLAFYVKFCVSFPFFRRLLAMCAVAAGSVTLIVASLPSLAHALALSPLFGCLAVALLLAFGGGAVAVYALIYAKYRRQSGLLGMMLTLSALTAALSAAALARDLRPLFLLLMALHGCVLLPVVAMSSFMMLQKMVSVPRHVISTAVCACSCVSAIVLLTLAAALKLQTRGVSVLLCEDALLLAATLLAGGVDVETMP